MLLEFNPNEGLIIVPTQLFGCQGDVIVNLALDTGATSSIINWDIAVLIGLDFFRKTCLTINLIKGFVDLSF